MGQFLLPVASGLLGWIRRLLMDLLSTCTQQLEEINVITSYLANFRHNFILLEIKFCFVCSGTPGFWTSAGSPARCL